MKKAPLITLLGMVIVMTGCRSGSHGHYYNDIPSTNYVPYLEEFNMVDSYGEDTYDYLYPAPAISPYVDNGLFEVYWFVDSVEDYIVEYRINTSPSVEDSRLINSDICGAGLACDQDGLQFCQYFDDFTITCDSNDNNDFYLIDISDMIFTVPQTLYLILQVCDIDSYVCEYDYLPVLME